MWHNINPYGAPPFSNRAPDGEPPAADPPPQGTAGGTPYPEDEVLTEWFSDCATIGGTDHGVIIDYGRALRRFSGFLSQNGLPALSAPGRLDDPDRLRRDAHVYIDRFPQPTNKKYLIPSLNRLIDLVTSGADRITIRGPKRPRRTVPDADEAQIKAAFPDRDGYSVNLTTSARAYSAWLHANGRPGLSDTDWLLSEQADADAVAYSWAHPGYAGRVNIVLAHLRARAGGEVPLIAKNQNTRTIPLADQRLARAYRDVAEDRAGACGIVYKKGKDGRDAIDRSITVLRSFSAWRTARGLPALTDHLHDPTLLTDAQMFVEEKSQAGRALNTTRRTLYMLNAALELLRASFPPGTPVTLPEEPADSFALPGSDWSGWDMSLSLPGAEGGPAPADSDSVSGRPADSFALPGSDWSGWGMSLSLGGHGPADSDSVFGGLAPLDSRERFSSDGLSGALASGWPEPGEVNQPGPSGTPFVNMRYATPPFRPDGVGFASGEGLSCLLDSILQRYHNIRRGPGTPRGLTDWLDGEVRRVREALSAQGVDLLPARGEIDIYGGAGSYLAGAMNVRLQVIQAEFQEEPDGTYVRYTSHPEMGRSDAPLVRLLHTPGHFQPLWG
uniref:HsvB type III effector n=1 Tax=Pantoea agglomerans pv. gypsophilae TaxID=48984 RepID=Q2LDQ5_PANAY|nr:HsvB type III effector [Pantoea agglomerans pv. gypsophilae]